VDKRILGKSGLSISSIGLGCWQLGGDFGVNAINNADNILTAADECNINFWDTADVYGDGQSEKTIGNWQSTKLKNRVIATKVGRNGDIYPNNYTYDKLIRNIEKSITNLKVDSIDLLQLHCIPPEQLYRDDIWLILERLKQQGLIKHYGASVETVEEALACVEKPGLTSLQVIFNLFRQDLVEKLLPAAEKYNVGIIARLPLASGLLSGKFDQHSQFSPQDHRNFNRNGECFNVGETFSGIPFEKGLKLVNSLKEIIPSDLSLAQASIRWILDHPQITSVIAGASSAEQVRENASVDQLTPLSKEVHKQLQAFYYLNVKQHVRGNI
jgi:aryl-alcohol dehydrogenase-like predicted oxidoreductase